MPTEEYESLSQELISKVTRYAEDKCGWTLTRNQEGVIVYQKRSKDFLGMMYKSEGLINAPPEVIFTYIRLAPDNPRIEWDRRIAGIEIIENVNADLVIMRTYTTSELAGIISARDFIDLITNVTADDYFASYGVSVTEPNYPDQPNFVRGFNYPSGIICHRVKGEPKLTNMVCILQPNLKGSVPSELIDAAMPSSIEEFYRHLRSYVAKKGKARIGCK